MTEETNKILTELEVYDICLKPIDPKRKKQPLEGSKGCTKKRAIELNASEKSLKDYKDNLLVLASHVLEYDSKYFPDAINILLHVEELERFVEYNPHGLIVRVTTRYNNKEKVSDLNVLTLYIATRSGNGDPMKSTFGNPYSKDYNLFPKDSNGNDTHKFYLAVTNVPINFNYGGTDEFAFPIPHPGENVLLFDDFRTETSFYVKIQLIGVDHLDDTGMPYDYTHLIIHEGEYLKTDADNSSSSRYAITFYGSYGNRINIYNNDQAVTYFSNRNVNYST